MRKFLNANCGWIAPSVTSFLITSFVQVFPLFIRLSA